jgi:hypothetical protein
MCRLATGELGFAGVHVAVLRTGKVILFSYDPSRENSLEFALWRLWDPVFGFESESTQVHNRNVFCAGHSFLPDGRLLVSGGQSYNFFPFVKSGADHDLHTFEPQTKSWTRHADMPAARWYPTCVALPNGLTLIAGGHAVRFRPIGANNDEYELFDWRTNSCSAPKRFNPGYDDLAYPFLKVLSDRSLNGLLFVHAQDTTRLFDLNSLAWKPQFFVTQNPGSRTYPHQGACVVLPLDDKWPTISKILVVGGEGEGDRASARAEIFQFDGSKIDSCYWRNPAGGHPAHERFMGDAVLLPDGNVLVINGASRGVADASYEPVMETELFNSTTESWSKLAQLNRPRLYHSAAVLLPDARVLISGNTHHFNPGNPVEDGTLEIFSPPYLYNGPRPWLQSTDGRMAYNSRHIITSPEAQQIDRVALVRPGSTTHTNNMEQRLVNLTIDQRTDTEIVVRTPVNQTLAPLGFYMLFIIDNAGRPSTASFVQLA